MGDSRPSSTPRLSFWTPPLNPHRRHGVSAVCCRRQTLRWSPQTKALLFLLCHCSLSRGEFLNPFQPTRRRRKGAAKRVCDFCDSPGRILRCVRCVAVVSCSCFVFCRQAKAGIFAPQCFCCAAHTRARTSPVAAAQWFQSVSVRARARAKCVSSSRYDS